MIEPIVQKIEALSGKASPLLVAIDGRCAAGKTTLGAQLQRALSCHVIPMDHFFLRPEQRTEERLGEPGGNVDYERFLAEVLRPLKQGERFSYRPYDCKRQDFAKAVTVEANAVAVIEGSYACHPTLREQYDLRIFMSVEPGVQLRRIRQRNGEEMAARFQNEWIPLEERYFAACRVRDCCDLVYET